jgi:hypothetical protein
MVLQSRSPVKMKDSARWAGAEEIKILRPAKNAGLRMTALLRGRHPIAEASEVKIPTLSQKREKGGASEYSGYD